MLLSNRCVEMVYVSTKITLLNQGRWKEAEMEEGLGGKSQVPSPFQTRICLPPPPLIQIRQCQHHTSIIGESGPQSWLRLCLGQYTITYSTNSPYCGWISRNEERNGWAYWSNHGRDLLKPYLLPSERTWMMNRNHWVCVRC